MAVWNDAAPITIQPATRVTAVTSTTVTLSKPLRSPGVKLHDGIMFITNPGWFQDAVTYAVENGFPLLAYGRGAESVGNTVGPTKIRVTDGPIVVPRSLFAPNLDLSTIQVEITGENGFVRDSCALGIFRWPMLIAYHGDGAAMLWDAQGYTPVDHGMGFSNNEEHFRAVVVQGGADSAKCFRFKAGTFSENRIALQELFGSRRPQEGGGYIDTLMEIEDSVEFRHNIVVAGHLHGFAGEGIKAGNKVHDNQWQTAKIAPAPGATSAVGIRSGGSNDTWTANISNDEMNAGETYGQAAVMNDTNRAFINARGSRPSVSWQRLETS